MNLLEDLEKLKKDNYTNNRYEGRALKKAIAIVKKHLLTGEELKLFVEDLWIISPSNNRILAKLKALTIKETPK